MFLILLLERKKNLLASHYRISHWFYFQMYLKRDFSVIFDHLFITIGFFTEFVFRSISKYFSSLDFKRDLRSLVYHHRFCHWFYSQMYLKKDFFSVIFDHLFITIGFFTEFIFRSIFKCFSSLDFNRDLRSLVYYHRIYHWRGHICGRIS